jgi:hypothetical protein
MCKYCEDTSGFNALNDTVDYSGLEIAISTKGSLRVRNYNFKKTFESQDMVNINYCPMCGEKLNH